MSCKAQAAVHAYFKSKKKAIKQDIKHHKPGGGVFRGTYHDYLKSPQWKKKRRKAHKHYRGRCTICGSTNSLQVHHRHYRTLFRESMADLDLLCGGCHQNHHESDGKACDPMTREFLSLHL